MRRGVVSGRPTGAARPLFSLLILVVAGLSLVSGTTFAPFSNDAQGGGRVTAGTVDVVVNDDPDDQATFTFTGPACNNLAPGESCTTSLTVRNIGTLVATYNVRVVDSSNSCYTSTLSSEATLESGPRPPGNVVTGTLTTALDNDQSRCQATTNTATVVVGARQARTPHP